MSDQAADHFEKEMSQATPGTTEGKSVTQSVTLHPNGQIEFNLVMGNKILAYGLIEVMRAQLDKLFLSQEINKAQPPMRNGGLGGLMKKMGG